MSDHRPFKEIPDNYDICTISENEPFMSPLVLFTNMSSGDLSAQDATFNKTVYVMYHSALAYAFAADGLFASYINQEKLRFYEPSRENGNKVFDFNIDPYCRQPMSFLCRHAVELLLKCVYAVQNSNGTKLPDKVPKGHCLYDLWHHLDHKDIPHTDELEKFVMEINGFDPKGLGFRYNIDMKYRVDGVTSYMFSPSRLLANTKFMFNTLGCWVMKQRADKLGEVLD